MVQMAKKTLKKNYNSDDYCVLPIGGGSLVGSRPVFSPDVELLFIPQKNVILSYSTKTGEFVRKFEGLNDNVITVKLNPLREEMLLAASKTGEIIGWRWKTATRIWSFVYWELNFLPQESVYFVRQSLTTEETVIAFTDVHFLPLSADNFDVYATWIDSTETAQVSVFSSKGTHTVTHIKCNEKEERLFFDLGCYDSGQFLCAATPSFLHIYDITQKIALKPKQSSFTPTCLACHPEKPIVAVGEVRGRVLVWSDVLNSERSVCAVYHWHTLPVQDVIFSRGGSGFFSGGNENVVVQWRLNSPFDKSFLPRLSGNILHLAVSLQNELLAISTADNAISIIDALKNTRCKIQNFSMGVIADTPHQTPFPAGLTLDPRSRSLVLNGKTGFIQFFDPRNQHLLYNVDISGQNNLCQERNAVIENTEVTRIALSSDGAWLATSEFNSTGALSFQVTLKFWCFDVIEKTYMLSMSIDVPHEGEINALQFRPTPAMVDTSSLDGLMAVSTGEDKKFRVWELCERQVINKKKFNWMSSRTAHYRDMPAGDVTFSNDGSVLGVAFGPCLTLWDPEECVLKSSLTHPRERSHIRFSRFGNEDCCHLVVTVTDDIMTVWNILSLTISWSVEMRVEAIATDPCSNFMAAFMKRSAFVFRPNSPSPVIVKRYLCEKDSTVVAAAFVPRSEVKSDSTERLNSHLCFLNSEQVLFSLVHSDETKTEELDSMPVCTADATTPFTLFKAESSKSDVKPVESDHRQVDSSGTKEVMKLLQLPTHTMAPVHLLCGSFLRSMVMTSSLASTKKEGAGDDSLVEEATDSLKSDEADSDEASEVDERPLKSKRKSMEVVSQDVVTPPNLERHLSAVAREDMKWAQSLLS